MGKKKLPLTYDNLGVSSQKEDVHKAIKDVDKGLFPSAFCKVIPDVLTGDGEKCLIFHADSAGTKTIIAYLHWRETGDARVFRGIAQDALVMNIDDIACAGLASGFVISNTIERNKFLITGDVIKEIIAGYQDVVDVMAPFGIALHLCGGETADVGDLIRTVTAECTVMARGHRASIIETVNAVPGDCIVGLSNTGKATYETAPNSSIGSNGITMARHAILAHDYAVKYPEIVDPSVKDAYLGKFHLQDKLPGGSTTIGTALLSPTRTYLPVLHALFTSFGSPKDLKERIHAIIHDTGGGQTKCMKFGSGVRYVKDDLFPVPEIFELIQQEGNVSWEEMYRVFNMGHRLELVCTKDYAEEAINTAKHFGIEAKVIGHVERNPGSSGNAVVIKTQAGTFTYA
nr:AIR synthase-related protein [Candidatus Sigynarchaeota archaeon]